MPPDEKDISYWMGRVDTTIADLSTQVGNHRVEQTNMREELRDWRADTDLRLSQGSNRFQTLEDRIDQHVQKGSRNHQGGNPEKNEAVTFKYLWDSYSTPVIVAFILWFLLEALPNILTYVH